jgi:hypothetical protein
MIYGKYGIKWAKLLKSNPFELKFLKINIRRIEAIIANDLDLPSRHV